MNFPVTLVIPILNEADSLPELLVAIECQTHWPDEVIFCDAGSTDGGLSLIDEWQAGVSYKINCRVISILGALPGEGRNAGVRGASNRWIAFLDGGVVPSNDWLEQLCRYALASQSPAVFGLCHFVAKAPFTKAVCALSYGQGTLHPALPGSLFDRQVFDEVGGFPEHLRAAEDLVWISALSDRLGPKEVCPMARVTYTHFPARWFDVVRKWKTYGANLAIARFEPGWQACHFFVVTVTYVLMLAGGQFGIIVLFLYLFFRGVVDPVRRSIERPWWGKQPSALLIALPLALAIDFAKWAGVLQAIVGGPVFRVKSD